MEEFDFIFNAVYGKLQTDMETINRNMVWFSLEQLRELYEKHCETSVLNFNALVDRFDRMQFYEELNLTGTMDRVEKYTSNISEPCKNLLSSNPLRF